MDLYRLYLLRRGRGSRLGAGRWLGPLLGTGPPLGRRGGLLGSCHRLYYRLNLLNHRLDLLNRQNLLDRLYLLYRGLLDLLPRRGLGLRLDRLLEVHLLLRRLNHRPRGRALGRRILVHGILVNRVGGGDNLGNGVGVPAFGHRPGIGFGLVCPAIPLVVDRIAVAQVVLHDLYQYRGCPRAYHVQHPGRRLGKIDNPGRNEGSPVINPYIDFSAVVQIRDREIGSEGQGRVGGGVQ
jgi:hypothetical protein